MKTARLDVFTAMHACRYYSHGDICLHVNPRVFTYRGAHTPRILVPSPLSALKVYMDVYIIKDSEHLISRVCVAASVLRKFLSYSG